MKSTLMRLEQSQASSKELEKKKKTDKTTRPRVDSDEKQKTPTSTKRNGPDSSSTGSWDSRSDNGDHDGSPWGLSRNHSDAMVLGDDDDLAPFNSARPTMASSSSSSSSSSSHVSSSSSSSSSSSFYPSFVKRQRVGNQDDADGDVMIVEATPRTFLHSTSSMPARFGLPGEMEEEEEVTLLPPREPGIPLEPSMDTEISLTSLLSFGRDPKSSNGGDQLLSSASESTGSLRKYILEIGLSESLDSDINVKADAVDRHQGSLPEIMPPLDGDGSPQKETDVVFLSESAPRVSQEEPQMSSPPSSPSLHEPMRSDSPVFDPEDLPLLIISPRKPKESSRPRAVLYKKANRRIVDSDEELHSSSDQELQCSDDNAENDKESVVVEDEESARSYDAKSAESEDDEEFATMDELLSAGSAANHARKDRGGLVLLDDEMFPEAAADARRRKGKEREKPERKSANFGLLGLFGLVDDNALWDKIFEEESRLHDAALEDVDDEDTEGTAGPDLLTAFSLDAKECWEKFVKTIPAVDPLTDPLLPLKSDTSPCV